MTGAAMWLNDAGNSSDGIVGPSGKVNNGADGAPVSSNTAQPIVNAVSGEPELDFCKQGVPAGTKLATGGTQPAGDKAVSAAQEGDEGCRGFAVAWNWDASVSATNPPAADCTASSAADGAMPDASTFPEPTSPASTAVWGAYGSELQYGQDNSAGLDLAYDPSKFSDEPPYTGERPGNWASGRQSRNDPACSETYRGLMRKGSWTTVKPHWSWAYDGTTTACFAPDTECVFPKPTSNTGKADIVDIDKSKPAGASGDATLKSCWTSVSRSVTTAEKKLYVAGWWYKDPSSVYKWSWKANSCQAPTSGASIAAPDATTGASIAATDATTLDNSNPPYGELPAGGYGVPASGGNVTGGKYVFDGKPIDVTNTGYWNSNRSCSYMTNGYLTAAAGGSWGTSITAQPGWGNGNTGGEVNPGAYTTMFTVTGMYPDDGDVGQGGEPDYTDKDCPVLGWGTHAVFCWELQATYTGHPGWNWYSLLGANTPELPNSSGFVSVYGTRDNR